MSNPGFVFDKAEWDALPKEQLALRIGLVDAIAAIIKADIALAKARTPHVNLVALGGKCTKEQVEAELAWARKSFGVEINIIIEPKGE